MFSLGISTVLESMLLSCRLTLYGFAAGLEIAAVRQRYGKSSRTLYAVLEEEDSKQTEMEVSKRLTTVLQSLPRLP